MFGASDEIEKSLRESKLLAFGILYDSTNNWFNEIYPPFLAMRKTQEEIDLEDAMAELDKEFPPIVDNKIGG